MTILFIYAKDCPECKEMRETLEEAIKESCAKDNCKIVSYDSETDEAIDIAIENDITDLPGCVIGSYVFFGDDYSYEDIVVAIDDTWKTI